MLRTAIPKTKHGGPGNIDGRKAQFLAFGIAPMSVFMNARLRACTPDDL